MRYILTIVLLQIAFISAINAQFSSDAIRYTYQEPLGTARSMGAGGAFGALGADFGVLQSNPAGIALFRKREFMFTPAYRYTTTDNTVKGSETTLNTEEGKFSLSNAGLVFVDKSSSRNWRNVNTAFGFNRLASFNNAIYYDDVAGSTIMTGFFAEALAESTNQFGSQLAIDANAIYPDDNGNLTYDFYDATDRPIRHTQSIKTSGSLNELTLAMAGNYKEKLMVGASLGIPIATFSLESEYSEADLASDTIPYFDQLKYTDNLSTTAFGFNMKFGAIYKINEMFRIGAAVHTPSFFSLSDTFNNSFEYTYTDGSGSNTTTADSPDGTSNYRLRTPLRGVFSAAAIFKSNGFLSAEVEMVDYGAAHFNFTKENNSTENAAYERQINQEVRDNYARRFNFKLGGEYAKDIFRVRAGLNLLGRPSVKDTDYDLAYSVGLGLRFNRKFFFDIGYRHSAANTTASPYTGFEVASLQNNSDFLLTLGFKF